MIIRKFIYVILINRVIFTSSLFNIYILINKSNIAIFTYYNYNKKDYKKYNYFHLYQIEINKKINLKTKFHELNIDENEKIYYFNNKKN